MTENHTPEFTLRIRLLATPSAGEFDEFHLEHYHVGQSYIVPARLASLLILAGYAELVGLKMAKPGQVFGADVTTVVWMHADGAADAGNCL